MRVRAPAQLSNKQEGGARRTLVRRAPGGVLHHGVNGFYITSRATLAAT
jgi:hypothetical protein